MTTNDVPRKAGLRYRKALWSGYNDMKADGDIGIKIMIKIYQEIKEVRDGIRPTQTETVIKKRESGLGAIRMIH